MIKRAKDKGEEEINVTLQSHGDNIIVILGDPRVMNLVSDVITHNISHTPTSQTQCAPLPSRAAAARRRILLRSHRRK